MDVTSWIYVGKTSTELTIKLVICGSEKAQKFVGSLPKFSETFPLFDSEVGPSLLVEYTRTSIIKRHAQSLWGFGTACFADTIP